ncbi:MAG: carbohydrate ABC transporter permease [Planctomycetes bacterium]|nr:carbohydrate ABC transporter permease [Planctomycetota bacterium]
MKHILLKGRTNWPAMIVLIIAGVVTLVPFVWLVLASMKTSGDFFTSTFLPRFEGKIDPSRLTLEHYRTLFTSLDLGRALLNSLCIASVGGVLSTLVSAMAGVALACYEFKGKRLATSVVLASVLIPAPLLLAPGYVLLHQLHLLDSLAGLILPMVASAFGVYLFRQAAKSSLSKEMLEAARIDGCSEWRMFWIIALPLLRPMIGAFMMVTFLGAWNNYIQPQVVLQSPEQFPLSVAVTQLKGQFYQDYGLQMAGTVVSIIPVLILLSLLRREFVAGLTAGAVKG